MRRNHSAGVLLALAVGLAAAAPAAAQTWTGAIDGFWSKPGNWSPAATPSFTSPDTQLTFGATANASMVNNASGLRPIFALNRLTFNADAPDYSLVGSTFSFK